VWLLSALAISVCTLCGAGYQHARSGNEGWREIAWPFPRDGWPAGRAFSLRCEGVRRGGRALCAAEDRLLQLRQWRRDDDEVDRVADLDLISERFLALDAGQPIRISDMQGRSRNYDLQMPDGSRHAAAGFALSRRCDLLVAAAQAAARPPVCSGRRWISWLHVT